MVPEPGRTFSSESYCDNIEPARPTLNLVYGKKISCDPPHFFNLRFVNRRFRRRKFLIRPCLDLDKNNRMVNIHHYNIYLA